MMIQLQTSLHPIVAAEFQERKTFRFARFFVRAVADGGGLHFGEVRGYGFGCCCEGEVAWRGCEMGPEERRDENEYL